MSKAKRLTLFMLTGLLAASTLFAGCSFIKSHSDTKVNSTAETKTAQSAEAATTTVETTAVASTAADNEGKNLVVYDNNGIKLTYTGYKKDIFPTLTYRLENSSDKSYMVTSEDVSVNDCMISTSIIETIAPGKKSAVKMTMFESDLKDNGIEKIEKVEFKLHCTNSNDWLDSFDSDIITITNP